MRNKYPGPCYRCGETVEREAALVWEIKCMCRQWSHPLADKIMALIEAHPPKEPTYDTKADSDGDDGA